jgi:serine/threonine protein kinase
MPNNLAAMKALIREVIISTHENLYDHPNVVRLMGISWMEEEESGETHDSTYPYRPILHVELAVRGDLRQFLLHQRDSLPLSEKMRICHEVSMGLKALHDCDIVHGDIKCDNILICQESSSPNEFTAKICDFSHSIPPYAKDLTLPGGTRPWNAPEWRLPLSNRVSLKATDVYSLGLLFWQVLCDGKDPFGLDGRETSEFLFSESGLAAKLDHIEATKRQGNELLDIAIRWASQQSFVVSDKEKIIHFFEATLQYDAVLRDLRKVLFIFDHSFPQSEILRYCIRI